MMKKLKLTFFFIACCISMEVEASTGHVIVAFDRAIPSYQSVYSNVRTLRSIDKFIKDELKFDDLYLSVVGYSLHGKDPDIEKFVIPYTDCAGKPLLWHNYESMVGLFPEWPKGEPTEMGNYVQPASMQSLAKPYCVMETAVCKKNQQAENTYVLFVTDEKVQGVDDDYAAEWRKMYYYNSKAYARIERQVFQRLQRFNEMYRFEIHNRKAIDNKYTMIIYKLLPASKPSIYSVSDMPSPLPIKRVRGGYVIDCKVKSKDANYEIRDWMVIGADGKTFDRDSDGKIFIKSSKLNDGDFIEIRMVVQQTDSLYGGALLNETNCTGMALRQPANVNDANKIWGFLPLADAFWWWMPEDIEAAVEIWEYIIFFFLIVALAYIFRTLSKYMGLYKPSNKKISMNIKTSK